MNDARLNYLIANGQYCVMFLGDLARGLRDDQVEKINRNAVLNHGIAVQSLMNELRISENDNRELRARLDACAKELRQLKSGEIDPIVSKRMEELKDMLKDSVIDFIDDF